MSREQRRAGLLMAHGSWLMALLIVSCTGSENPNVRGFAAEDPHMKAAIDSARQGVQVFLHRLDSAGAAPAGMTVKVRLGDEAKGEHIWLTAVERRGDVLRGRLTEDAVQFPDRKAGDWAEARPDSLSDWMIVGNGVLCGGWTLRVARARMTNAERTALDESLRSAGVTSWAPVNHC
jgi:uncharacterized protein YegJ (DUF2314 family)